MTDLSIYFVFDVAISFYNLNVEVWEIFLCTGCYRAISLSCTFFAGIYGAFSLFVLLDWSLPVVSI